MSRRELRPVGPYPGPYPTPPPSKCAKVLYYTWRLCSVVFAHLVMTRLLVLYYTWRLCSVVFAHLVMISLVVAYCILGAVTFERLEAQHEKEVKQNISFIRLNTTHSIWSMTNATPVLVQANWTHDVTDMLKDFENAILLEMKVRGWDGNESTDHIQWTFTGALFYSIIVITTIGYGHIAPKTQTGKVVTILYAILGIPLMLLCLSNIGDVMASSFRFLYWRLCCYVCTRPPKRRHHHHHPSIRRSVRGSRRGRRPTLQRAHSDTECRYRASGSAPGSHPGRHPRSRARLDSQPPINVYGSRPTDLWDHGPRDLAAEHSPARYDKEDRDDVEAEFPREPLRIHDLEMALKDLEEQQKKLLMRETRSKSLPRPSKVTDYGPRKHLDFNGTGDHDDRDLLQMHDLHDVDYENYREKKERELEERRRDYGYRDRGYDSEDEEDDSQRRCDRRSYGGEERFRRYPEYFDRELDTHPRNHQGRRARSAVAGRWEEGRGRPSEDEEGRWGDVEGREEGRPRRLRRLRTVDESARHSVRYSPSPDREEWSDEEPWILTRRSCPPADWAYVEGYPMLGDTQPKEELKPVPIWLCVVLVGGYIVAGTFLFRRWEGWSALDAAYFCFITLTTIGFGDFVPAQGVRGSTDPLAGSSAAAAVHSLALCALYVLVGIALLAMAFNLVQEEVRANVASVATKLGIIKPKPVDYRDY